MTTFRIDLANFVVTGENSSGILATCDAEVGNLPVAGCKLMLREDGESTLLALPVTLPERAMHALHAVVEWAWTAKRAETGE